MAIGDDATAAGMALTSGISAANTIDTEINQTRDYLAQGKMKDGALAPAKLSGAVPISKGGTGGTTVQEAAGYLKVVPWTAVAPAGNAYSSMIARFSSQGRLQVVGPAVNDDVATKYYVDATTTAAIAELLDAIAELTARVAALESKQP